MIKYYLGDLNNEIELIPEGRSVQRKTIKIERTKRTAKGRLVKELIAEKLQFIISYSELNETKYYAIEAEVLKKTELSFYYYDTNIVLHSYTVQASEISADQKGDGYFENVSFTLEEV